MQIKVNLTIKKKKQQLYSLKNDSIDWILSSI